jgi:hypothetical protein
MLYETLKTYYKSELIMTLLRVIFIYTILVLLHFFIYIYYIGTTGLPGGDVGMAPIAVFLVSSASALIASIIYFLFSLKYSLSFFTTVLIYQLSFLSFGVFLGGQNFWNVITNLNYSNVELAAYVISIALSLILILSNYIIKKITD